MNIIKNPTQFLSYKDLYDHRPNMITDRLIYTQINKLCMR